MQQLALYVSWTDRPRALRLDFGVLVLERPMITLRARDDAVVFTAVAAALEIAPYKDAMIELRPPGRSVVYMTGFTGQQFRDRLARELIERYEAVGMDSRKRSDRQRVKQVWQPSTLALLQQCGALLRDPAA